MPSDPEADTRGVEPDDVELKLADCERFYGYTCTRLDAEVAKRREAELERDEWKRNADDADEVADLRVRIMEAEVQRLREALAEKANVDWEADRHCRIVNARCQRLRTAIRWLWETGPDWPQLPACITNESREVRCGDCESCFAAAALDRVNVCSRCGGDDPTCYICGTAAALDREGENDE